MDAEDRRNILIDPGQYRQERLSYENHIGYNYKLYFRYIALRNHFIKFESGKTGEERLRHQRTFEIVNATIKLLKHHLQALEKKAETLLMCD